MAQFVVYVIQKTVSDTELQLELIEVDLGLTEASYLLAALALPWAWLLGLLIPLKECCHELLKLFEYLNI